MSESPALAYAHGQDDWSDEEAPKGGEQTAAEWVAPAWPEANEYIQTLFHELHMAWTSETACESNVRAIIGNTEYRQIIGLGPPVVPLIIRELVREPNHWHTALNAITRADPVPPEHAGDLDAIARDWARWARLQGIDY